MVLRDENKLLAADAAAYTHGYESKRHRRQRLPEPGDLVLVRNHAVDRQHGRKLEAKWLGPRLFVKWSSHRRSGYIRELHGDGKLKRYSIDDILQYHQRGPVFVGSVLLTPSVGTSPVHISDTRTSSSNIGGRAVFLTPQ